MTEWKNPTVHVGDTLIFKHKKGPYNHLHIFRNKRAFDLCNFSQSVLLNDDGANSDSFTWHPWKPGYFYFSYNNGTSAGACREGEKVTVRVTRRQPEADTSPSPSPSSEEAPPPSAGGSFRSSPALPWRKLVPSANAPGASPPAAAPVARPDSGGGIPFITSNPAVPLPTGETDAATIRPLPTSGAVRHHSQVLRSVQAHLGTFMFVLYILC
ncbi:hypothetical protein H6P81_015617 [Aristolochia fimbriata]|uniref:Phytocyanin domain-containing protein n=1 Tax=Aristolochia fimbriata TaxID=158543 RepID=A0AAV7E664_ARIFI|nr:hypothetical protein H6P81_015617 [Aristolochia fimbriata]